MWNTNKVTIFLQLGDIKVENEDAGPATFNKRLLKIFRKDRLQHGERSYHSDLVAYDG